jgi:hypothetical protein
MRKNSAIVELYTSPITNRQSGVIKVSEETLSSVRQLMAQSMLANAAHAASIKKSIRENGFVDAFYVTMSKDHKVTDGFTRLTACCELAEEGFEFLVDFKVSAADPQGFNSASRGTTPADIAGIFKLGRENGRQCGSAIRAAKQSIEASKILDVMKCNGDVNKAFEAGADQRHMSKIVRERATFEKAFRAVSDICTGMGVNPDDIEFAHWIALFCRHGVTPTSEAVATQNVVMTSSKRSRDSRLATFNSMSHICTMEGTL